MIRVRSQIADRWRIQITKAKTSITILSPYITETRTLTSLKGRQVRIYTLFSLKNFASGASDLELLKRLVATEQHEVYELKELHAKVVMDEEGFVTLGSQNLTARGEQKNLELSICIDGDSLPRTCKRVRDIVKQWIEDAKPITASRLARMENDLATAKKLYRDFQRVADELQEKLNTEEEENERERRNLAQRQMRDATRAAVGRLKHAEGNRRATLCKYDSRPPYLGLPPSEESLMNWKCGNRDVSLEPQRRYLCIREDGVLGWARVENKSITVITSSITSGATLKPFPKLELTLYADGSPLMPNVPDDYNVAATLTKCNREVCIVPMRFSFEKLIIGISGGTLSTERPAKLQPSTNNPRSNEVDLK